MHFIIIILLTLLGAPVAEGAARKPERQSGSIAPTLAVEDLTGGARLRAVWVRSTGAPDDPGSWSPNGQQLAAFDSQDGQGERLVLEEMTNYFKPLLTHDGERIVFSNRHTVETFIVDFDGSNKRFLAPGNAAALWLDPGSGEEYVIAQMDAKNADSPIVRYKISDPQPEVLWDRTPVNIGSPGSLQISRDGRRIASVFPWPAGGVAEVPNIAWKHGSKGCWPGIAPDNSYLAFVFHGNHREIVLQDPAETETRRVRINTAEALRNFEVYHPAWTNHPRYLVVTGPYSGGEGKKQIDAGGTQVEVYVGRFDPGIQEVEAWSRITKNDFADFVPNVWIEGGAEAELEGRQLSMVSLEEKETNLENTWPGTKDGLVFLWKNDRDTPQLIDSEGGRPSVRLEAGGGARFGPRFDMDLSAGGHFSADGAGEVLSSRVAKSGAFTMEAVVTPLQGKAEGKARIFSLADEEGAAAFSLTQEGNQLIFRLVTSTTGPQGFEARLAEVEVGSPLHVVASYRPGQFFAFVNGGEAVRSTLETGSLDRWEQSGTILFGDKLASPWQGRIEGVALYDRALTPSEALKKCELYALPTPYKPSVEIAAKRLTKEKSPAPSDIAPYRRALTVNRFLVEPGHPLEGKEIFVAEWSLLDGEVPEFYANAALGEKLHLQLDPIDDHPQLESERLLYSGTEWDEEIYYSMASGQ